MQSRCNLNETKDQQVAHYVNGLNYNIQDQLAMQSLWSVDQAQNFALRAERVMKNRRFPRGNTSRAPEVDHKAHATKTNRPTLESKAKETELKKIDPKLKEKAETSKGIRCFKCNEVGHKSSDCPRRKFTNFTQQEEEVFEEEECEEEGDYEEAKEEGDEVVCMVKRLLYTPTQPEESQRK